MVLPAPQLVLRENSPITNARQELKKGALKALYKLRKEMGNHFRENIKLTMMLFDALISPILFYASEVVEVCGIDCIDCIGLKWLLGVNKYCNNNACRTEMGRFAMRIDAQCRNFKMARLDFLGGIPPKFKH